MNYVNTALRTRLGPDRIAVIAEGEEGTVRRISYGQLRTDVMAFARGLRRIGLAPGDRIGIFMPMTYECVVAVLAVGYIGAVYIPIFSGYAADAIAAGCARAHRPVALSPPPASTPRADRADEAHRRCGGRRRTERRHVIVSPRLCRILDAPRDVTWPMSSRVRDGGWDPADTSAEDPFMVIYTSCTTGSRRGRARARWIPGEGGAGLAHCFDCRMATSPWMTDIGWMMVPAYCRWAHARARSSCTRDAGFPTRRACGRWSSATASRTSASRRRDPRAHAQRRGAGEGSRPLVAVRAWINWRAVESRSVVVVLQKSEIRAARSSTTGRHRGSAASLDARRGHRYSPARSSARARGWTRTSSTDRRSVRGAVGEL